MNDFTSLKAGSSSSYRNKVKKLFVFIVRTPTFYAGRFFNYIRLTSLFKTPYVRIINVSMPRRYLLCLPFG